MAELYEQHNTDDVLVRSVIAGLLNLLNNNIHYSQVWSGDTVEDLTVPWYYNFSHANNERFLQDNYTFFGKRCFKERKIDGDFNEYPKGILTYQSSNINSSSMTNIFTTGKYMKNNNGVLTSYTSFFYSIPIDMTFKCDVYTADTDFLSILKIEQAIRDTFYKNKSFYVTFKGMRVGCTVGFPEQNEFTTSMELTHDNTTRENKLSFSLGIETYQPVFDPSQEMPTDCSMSAIGFNTKIVNDSNIELNIIQPISGSNVIYSSGSPIAIEWNIKSADDLNSLIIKWIDESTKEEHYIAKGIYGFREEYIWNIPETISNFKQPLITIDDSDISFIEKANIKVTPINGYINEQSFRVLDGGKLNTDNQYVDFSLEYEDKLGNIIIDDNYKFKSNNGIIEKVVLKDEPKEYKGEVNIKNISIEIEIIGDNKISAKAEHIKIL